jgi:hypothetical protein
MKNLFLLLLLSLSLATGQTVTVQKPPVDRTYYVESYGAKTGDSIDDRAAIQLAITAARTTGGVVQFGPGTYTVVPSSGIGIEVPTGVILRGVGSGTIINGITAGSASAFCVISNDDYNTATTDYGAHSIQVEHLKVTVDATTGGQSSNCHSLIGVGHAPSARIQGVTFGGCYYHALEFNRCGAVNGQLVVMDCVFTGSYNQSMPVEFDGGGALAQVSSTPPTKTVRNIWLQRCRFEQRPAGDASTTQHILLTHNVEDILENVTIRDCVFLCHNPTTFTTTASSIAPDTIFTRIRGLTIENCTFIGASLTNTYLLYLPNDASTEQYDQVLVKGNTFSGQYRMGVLVGATAGSTTATLHSTRRGIRIENNMFSPQFAVNPYVSGRATAGASGTLTDTTKEWTTNEFANGTVSIVSGVGVGQTKTITSNTATVLTISGTFSPTPTSQSYYRIDRQYGAAVTTGTATSGTTTTVVQSTRTWVAGELNGFYCTITSGTNNGQTKQITANTATTLTTAAFSSAIDATSVYRIDRTPAHDDVVLWAVTDAIVSGNVGAWPADWTGIATPGTNIGLNIGTSRNVRVQNNHWDFAHTAAQLAAPTGGYFIPYQADLTKLQTNSLTSTFYALQNTVDCGSSAVWLVWYEPTNSDSRTSSWTYLTGKQDGNIFLSGSGSSGQVAWFQRNDFALNPSQPYASAPTVASSGTIAPTTPIAFVSGTTTINTITPTNAVALTGGSITLIPTGLWSTGTSGNIAIATTAVVSKALTLTYDSATAKWYPNY